jgi:hypothetical protein
MKIEQNELEKLQSLHNDLSLSKSDLSDTVVNLSSLKEKKRSLISKVEISHGLLEQFQLELIGKYSTSNRIRIDLSSGEITEL